MSQRIKVQDGVIVYGPADPSQSLDFTVAGSVSVIGSGGTTGTITTNIGEKLQLTTGDGGILSISQGTGTSQLLINNAQWPTTIPTTGSFIGASASNVLSYLPFVYQSASSDALTVSELNTAYPDIIPGQYVIGPTTVYLCVAPSTWRILGNSGSGSGSAGPLNIKTQTSNYTLQLSDATETLVRMDSPTPVVVNIPADSNVDMPVGSNVLVGWAGIGAVAIGYDSGVTVDTPETYNLNKQFSKIGVIKVGANHWELEGNLEPLATMPTPTVSSITPNTGSTLGGTAVTIAGTNFIGATSVTIGGTAATSVVVVSDVSITCVTPAGALGVADVTVTTPNGVNPVNSLYTYAVPVYVPSITTTINGSSTGGSTNATGNVNYRYSYGDAVDTTITNGMPNGAIDFSGLPVTYFNSSGVFVNNNASNTNTPGVVSSTIIYKDPTNTTQYGNTITVNQVIVPKPTINGNSSLTQSSTYSYGSSTTLNIVGCDPTGTLSVYTNGTLIATIYPYGTSGQPSNQCFTATGTYSETTTSSTANAPGTYTQTYVFTPGSALAAASVGTTTITNTLTVTAASPLIKIVDNSTGVTLINNLSGSVSCSYAIGDSITTTISNGLPNGAIDFSGLGTEYFNSSGVYINNNSSAPGPTGTTVTSISYKDSTNTTQYASATLTTTVTNRAYTPSVTLNGQNLQTGTVSYTYGDDADVVITGADPAGYVTAGSVTVYAYGSGQPATFDINGDFTNNNTNATDIPPTATGVPNATTWTFYHADNSVYLTFTAYVEVLPNPMLTIVPSTFVNGSYATVTLSGLLPNAAFSSTDSSGYYTGLTNNVGPSNGQPTGEWVVAGAFTSGPPGTPTPGSYNISVTVTATGQTIYAYYTTT